MTKIFIFCSWDTCSHFPLQITNSLPWRRTTWQSGWRDLADFSEASTFMISLFLCWRIGRIADRSGRLVLACQPASGCRYRRDERHSIHPASHRNSCCQLPIFGCDWSGREAVPWSIRDEYGGTWDERHNQKCYLITHKDNATDEN